jgi:hypothetical protein
VTVASTGKVSAARPLGLQAPALSACLAKEAAALRFPRHPDKELTFRFPLVYRKGP